MFGQERVSYLNLARFETGGETAVDADHPLFPNPMHTCLSFRPIIGSIGNEGRCLRLDEKWRASGSLRLPIKTALVLSTRNLIKIQKLQSNRKQTAIIMAVGGRLSALVLLSPPLPPSALALTPS